MISNKTKIRVRYAETDQMGYVHHSIYAQYFEIGRTELMRSFGFPYAELEEKGIMLPVVKLSCQFIAPARYDEVLEIETIVQNPPTVKFVFDYIIRNERSEIINRGNTFLAFMSSDTRKAIRPPKSITENFIKNFK